MSHFEVSSWFVEQALLKHSEPVRSFTMGSSDYTDFVTQWPSFKVKWNQVRAVRVGVTLANEDGTFNFLRTSPINMRNDCVLRMGYKGDGNTLNIKEATLEETATQIKYAEGITFNDDGLIMYTVNDDLSAAIEQWDLTDAYNISTAVQRNSHGVQTENGYIQGVAFKSDGTKMYTVDKTSGKVYQYSLSTPWDVTTETYDSVSKSLLAENTGPSGIHFKPDGTKFYISGLTGDEVNQYSLSTAWDLSTAAFETGKTLSLGAAVYYPTDLTMSSDGTVLFICDDGTGGGSRLIHRFILSTPWDITTATNTGDTLATDDNYPAGICLNADENRLYVVGDTSPRIYQYDLRLETIEIFNGKTDKFEMVGGTIKITLADKFKQLSERVVGTSDNPVTYTGSNYLLSDIAWWVCTSYGGLSSVKSSSNVDIDYDSYATWSGVFSGDSVFLNARFTGTKVTEALSKIANISHSAIFQENNKLNFHRFSAANSYTSTLGNDETINLSISVDDKTVINKQYVGLDYDVTSRYHKSTVVDQASSSVNSYGLKESILKDQSMWYVNSLSAINYAQRVTQTQGEPYAKVKMSTPLIGMLRQVGEMVYVTDDQVGLSSDVFRIMERSINMNNGKVEFVADPSQLLAGFTLDVSSLDGSDVLL